MNIVKSKHASHRCKNRSVPDGILELLEDFGMRKRRAGADVLYFDNKSKKRILHNLFSAVLLLVLGLFETMLFVFLSMVFFAYAMVL